MTREESIIWLEGIKTAIGQHQYRNLWNFEQPLAEIIELLQSGKLIELPCRVGEEIYVLNKESIPQRMILGRPDIKCYCPKEDYLCKASCDDMKHCYCAYHFNYDGSDIGEKVFHTKEEAEAKLKELNNGKS